MKNFDIEKIQKAEKPMNELKKQYFKLAKKNHPDCGGSLEVMKAINNKYDELLKTININVKPNEENIFDADFKAVIDALIKLNMKDVNIDVVGYYIWINGDTKKYKEELKALKLRWHSKRLSWYFKPVWLKSKYNKKASMSNLKNKYGCTSYNNDSNSYSKELEALTN